ncbi:hypothetical protein E2C01_032719 [Portunus trituberculatus]|uniref:Uncharacterized protein n=1 Tax=Portunus trituberculatus TaxID=210409 RepID=A0A5B7F3N0_PORTR|nr:hypothetical protein [Portunus trituberculatus]
MLVSPVFTTGGWGGDSLGARFSGYSFGVVGSGGQHSSPTPNLDSFALNFTTSSLHGLLLWRGQKSTYQKQPHMQKKMKDKHFGVILVNYREIEEVPSVLNAGRLHMRHEKSGSWIQDSLTTSEQPAAKWHP